MAKVNQAQEPSMEEILASIRRIISDDGDDAPLSARGPGPISTDAIDALFGARAAVADDTDPIPSFLRQEPPTAARAPRAPEPRISESRAPEPRASEARAPEARASEQRAQEARAPEPRVDAAPKIEQRMAVEPPAKPKVEPPRAEPLYRAPPPPAATVQPAPVEPPLPHAEPRRQVPVLVAAEELPAGRPLLSADTDAAVSASFGDLATTLLSGNARTIEDLVKDMLRPMLKSWLDTNLPPLVERLVRDEIERVSRGR